MSFVCCRGLSAEAVEFPSCAKNGLSHLCRFSKVCPLRQPRSEQSVVEKSNICQREDYPGAHRRLRSSPLAHRFAIYRLGQRFERPLGRRLVSNFYEDGSPDTTAVSVSLSFARGARPIGTKGMSQNALSARGFLGGRGVRRSTKRGFGGGDWRILHPGLQRVESRDRYQKEFEKLLRDLRTEEAAGTESD